MSTSQGSIPVLTILRCCGRRNCRYARLCDSECGLGGCDCYGRHGLKVPLCHALSLQRCVGYCSGCNSARLRHIVSTQTPSPAAAAATTTPSAGGPGGPGGAARAPRPPAALGGHGDDHRWRAVGGARQRCGRVVAGGGPSDDGGSRVSLGVVRQGAHDGRRARDGARRWRERDGPGRGVAATAGARHGPRPHDPRLCRGHGPHHRCHAVSYCVDVLLERGDLLTALAVEVTPMTMVGVAFGPLAVEYHIYVELFVCITVIVTVPGTPAVRVMTRWTATCSPDSIILHCPDGMDEYGMELDMVSYAQASSLSSHTMLKAPPPHLS